MEYRGISYNVVQTIDCAFRWSVKRTDNYKNGIAICRNDAILDAKRFIDSMIRTKGRSDGISPLTRFAIR